MKSVRCCPFLFDVLWRLYLLFIYIYQTVCHNWIKTDVSSEVYLSQTGGLPNVKELNLPNYFLTAGGEQIDECLSREQ